MGKAPSLCQNGMDVTKLTHKKMLQTLENGVRFGKWVLLENIGEVGKVLSISPLPNLKIRQTLPRSERIVCARALPWFDCHILVFECLSYLLVIDRRVGWGKRGQGVRGGGGRLAPYYQMPRARARRRFLDENPVPLNSVCSPSCTVA